METGKVVLMHGFSSEEALAIMKAAKEAVKDPASIAFALSTPTNLEWTVSYLVEHVTEEHDYMRKNPPKFA